MRVSSVILGILVLGLGQFGEGHLAWGSDFWSPRAAGIGGAGHGGPNLTDSIYQNPSYAAMLPTYAVSANYLFYNGLGDQGSNDYHGHGLNFSLQDGRSELFQAGVGLTLREDANVVNIGAAKAIVKRIGVGIGGKMLFPKDDSHAQVRDTIFSVTVIPADIIQASIIIDNIFQSDEAKAKNLYREYILGTKTNVAGIVLVYFDPHLAPDVPNESSFGYEAGLEFPTFQDVILRLGAFRNAFVPHEDTRGRGYSIGVGWIGPRLSVDYAYTRTIEPIGATAHIIGATAYF